MIVCYFPICHSILFVFFLGRSRVDRAVRSGTNGRPTDRAAIPAQAVVDVDRPRAQRPSRVAVVGRRRAHPGDAAVSPVTLTSRGISWGLADDAAVSRSPRRRAGTTTGRLRRNGRRQRPLLGRHGLHHSLQQRTYRAQPAVTESLSRYRVAGIITSEQECLKISPRNIKR